MTTRFDKPALLINLASGSASDISDEATIMLQDKGHAAPEVFLADGQTIGGMLTALREFLPDLIIVYGGDGTCRSAAQIARDLDSPLIALPGGTMNILPKALYDTVDWKEALTLALSQSSPRWQRGGVINGRPFYCGAIIGAPTRMATVREDVRDGNISAAVSAIPQVVQSVTEGETFAYHVDGEHYDHQANAIMLTFPPYTSEGDDGHGLEMAAVMPLSMGELLKVGAQSLMSDWRDSEEVDVKIIKTLEINGDGHFETLLDGEAETLSCPLIVSQERQGVKVMAPRTVPTA